MGSLILQSPATGFDNQTFFVLTAVKERVKSINHTVPDNVPLASSSNANFTYRNQLRLEGINLRDHEVFYWIGGILYSYVIGQPMMVNLETSISKNLEEQSLVFDYSSNYLIDTINF